MNKDISRLSFRAMSLYFWIALVGLVFIGKLFYLQVIRHDHYAALATDEQQSKFIVPASRGSIEAFDGQTPVPLVLNENLPTVFADPNGITNVEATATALSNILKIPRRKIEPKLSTDTRYEVIAKRVSHNRALKVKKAELAGIGLTDTYYRVYPQRGLAAHVLGFVNDEGKGQYGIEEHLDDQLKGKNGRLNAVTDVYGIPLTATEQSVSKPAVDGDDLVLTIDVNIQKTAEAAIKKVAKQTKAKSASAIVLDPHTGAIKAMASYPTFDPAKFGQAKDFSVFINPVVANAYEPGSVIKVFTMAAGLNEGVITPSSKYQNKGEIEVDGETIENVLQSVNGQRTMSEVIQYSLNTGVVHVLKELGGGELNQKGREMLYDYFTDRFNFGKAVKVAQPYESSGEIFKPNTGIGDNIRYANMSFGQGMTATMVQVASALNPLLNGGDFYKPYLLQSQTDTDGQQTVFESEIIKKNIVSDKAAKQVKKMMIDVVNKGGGQVAKRDGYAIGGKTGTAQFIDPTTGKYSKKGEIGSFLGFVGRSVNSQDFVIMTRIDEPRFVEYAGSGAAAPIFAEISNWLIDFYQIPPGN